MAEASALQLPARVALLGNPNCGKTALFNLLTGSRQKVANYAGVTVERKEGLLRSPSGRRVFVLDLPGAYSLNALSADEAVTRDVVTGKSEEALTLLTSIDDPVAHEVRGDALFALGRKDQARDAYNKALAQLDVAAPQRRLVELKLSQAGGTPPKPDSAS